MRLDHIYHCNFAQYFLRIQFGPLENRAVEHWIASVAFSIVPISNAPMLQIFVGQKFSGGDSGGVTPVPIPNTAVKPSSADGTIGFPYGRVGRRRIYFKGPISKEVGLFFFFWLNSARISPWDMVMDWHRVVKATLQ